MKDKALFLLLLCVVLCSRSQLFSEDNAAADPRALLRSAHEVSGLVDAMPYQFQGTVVFNPGPGEVKGQITIYRDKERSRLDLQMGSYRESRLVLGNKLYIVRSTSFPAPGMNRLTDADRAWDRLVQDGDATLGGVSHKKVLNTQADCFEVKGEQKHRLCYDPSRKVLLENQDEVQSIQFSDYQAVTEAHQFYPRKIVVLAELERTEKPILMVEDIAVQKAALAPSTFALPEHPLELETCENMQPAKLLEFVRPQLQHSVMARNSGTPGVYAYGIVDKDGRLQNIKVLTSDADLQEAIVDALKQRKYSPATCGSNAIASEQVIQIPLMGAERGRR
jgi:hypothetical protein